MSPGSRTSLAVADRLAVSDLVHAYASAVDDRRFADVVELFTETAELKLPDPPRWMEPVRCHHGRQALRAALATLARVTRTEHAIIGEVYARAEDANCALGRVACIAHHWTETAGSVTDVAWHLHYDDEYLRTPGGWRIRRRALTINAIATPAFSRVRAHPAIDPTADAGPSPTSTGRPPGNTRTTGRSRDIP